ncbi:hypothetical protein EON68_04900, partial [archaeon]
PAALGGTCLACGGDPLSTPPKTRTLLEAVRNQLAGGQVHSMKTYRGRRGFEVALSDVTAKQMDDSLMAALRSTRRLSLVLDIDHTLVHAIKDPRIDALFDHADEKYRRDLHAFNDGAGRLYVKLRPGAHAFLATVRLHECLHTCAPLVSVGLVGARHARCVVPVCACRRALGAVRAHCTPVRKRGTHFRARAHTCPRAFDARPLTCSTQAHPGPMAASLTDVATLATRVCSKPEDFFAANEALAEQLKRALVTTYAHAAETSYPAAITDMLPQLYVDGFDSESIWAELCIANTPLLSSARRDVKVLSTALLGDASKRADAQAAGTGVHSKSSKRGRVVD